MKKIFCMMMCFGIVMAANISAYAAVGCDLNDPDKDVARLFPAQLAIKLNIFP